MSDIEKNMAFWCCLIGIVWLTVAVTGWRKGRIWAGSLGFRPFRPVRAENPVAFWVCFLFLLLSGAGLLLFSAALFTGIWNIAA